MGGPHRKPLPIFSYPSEDLIEISEPLLAHLSLDATQVSKVKYHLLRLLRNHGGNVRVRAPRFEAAFPRG